MSMPAVAITLQKAMRPPGPAATSRLPARALPIVVLGTGLDVYESQGSRVEAPRPQTALNILFALERYRQYPQSTLIASGGHAAGMEDAVAEATVIAAALRRNGVPPDRIVLETSSGTTREQAVATSRLLVARAEPTCIVVTSPQQMRRAVDLFRREGITALPIPADAIMWSSAAMTRWWLWLVPSTQARGVSQDVMYEAMAWPYYRLRGWLN